MPLRRFDAPTDFNENDPPKKDEKKSLVDEAYERAERDARKAHEAGPPAGANWVRGRD